MAAMRKFAIHTILHCFLSSAYMSSGTIIALSSTADKGLSSASLNPYESPTSAILATPSIIATASCSGNADCQVLSSNDYSNRVSASVSHLQLLENRTWSISLTGLPELPATLFETPMTTEKASKLDTALETRSRKTGYSYILAYSTSLAASSILVSELERKSRGSLNSSHFFATHQLTMGTSKYTTTDSESFSVRSLSIDGFQKTESNMQTRSQTLKTLILTSFSRQVSDSFVQVESTTLVRINPSNINLSQIPSSSAEDDKRQKNRSGINTYTTVKIVTSYLSESLFMPSSFEGLTRSKSYFLTNRIKTKMMTSFMLSASVMLAVTRTEANTTIAHSSAVVNEKNNNITATIARTHSYGSKDSSLISTSYHLQPSRPASLTTYLTMNSNGVSTSALLATQTSYTTGSTASGSEVRPSTPMELPKTSISKAPATSSPFVPDQYLIFVVFGLFRNESFDQDLVSHTTTRFRLLAVNLTNELLNLFSGPGKLMKVEVLNFTQYNNSKSVAFSSRMYFNFSANITARSVHDTINSNSMLISGLSTTEFCSSISCNMHGICNQTSSLVYCSCNLGFSGVRCQQAYPVDGNYTEWSSFQSCSKTCNEGIQIRTRTCSNPLPINGGENCAKLGPEKETKACKLKSCDDKKLALWIIIAAVAFILLLAIILACCFRKKKKYYYPDYGLNKEGRSYSLTRKAYTNQAYELQLSDLRAESSVVPLQIVKDDPFETTYANQSIAIDRPDNNTSNGVYRRELKSFLENTHRFRAKDQNDNSQGEHIE